ncbi:MAG: septum formation initiator family protein [Clostridia bacterium]|nr:septum formation initiator family protein [Clostridia bacterium]
MKNEKVTKRILPSFLIGIVVIVIVVLLLVVAIRSLIKSNELSKELEACEKELVEVENENQRLKNELSKELDEETIIKIAGDDLGLVDPDAEYYYSD